MERVGVIVHPRRDLETPLGALREWTSGRGWQLVQLPVAGQDRVVAPAGQPADCEFIVALGGDGTALAALHAAAAVGRPVLSAACGSLGALTSVVAEELREALDRMVAGQWAQRRLPALLLEGSGQPSLRALNDLVFIRGGAGQVSVSITVEDQLFVRFGGDGLVVATPLGSSAYSVAAGGPLLASDGDGLVVTPLAPHGGFCPPLVAGPASRLDVEIEPGHGGARLERTVSRRRCCSASSGGRSPSAWCRTTRRSPCWAGRSRCSPACAAAAS